MGSMMTPAEERLVLSVLLLWVEEYFKSKTRTIIVSSIYIIYKWIYASKTSIIYTVSPQRSQFFKTTYIFWGAASQLDFGGLERWESTAATVLPNSVIVICIYFTHLKSD